MKSEFAALWKYSNEQHPPVQYFARLVVTSILFDLFEGFAPYTRVQFAGELACSVVETVEDVLSGQISWDVGPS